MATVTATATASPPRSPTPALSQLRSLHRAAARSFLLRDYSAAAAALSASTSLLATLPTPDPDRWLVQLEHDHPAQTDKTLELRRKLAILHITFCATVRSSSAGPVEPSLVSQYPILALAPPELLLSLWSALLPSRFPTPGEILPNPAAAFVHPSLPTALGLAALKLNEPRLARAIAEAWFGSVDPRVERVVFDALASSLAGQVLPFAFAEPTMDASTASLTGATPAAGEADGKAALATSWIKLHDLLVLHVLPKLDEWEAAGDWARSQAVENGGFLPDERVDATLKQLVLLRERAMQAHLAAVERDRALAAEVTKSQQRRKGKARADPSVSPPSKKTRPSGTPSASTSSSPSPAAPAEPITGFAALRSSLTTFLEQPQSTSTPANVPSTSSSSFVGRFLAALRAQDPARLLAIVCVAFAAVSWIRRLRRGRRSVRELIGDVVGKVGETVRMGTKVSTL